MFPLASNSCYTNQVLHWEPGPAHSGGLSTFFGSSFSPAGVDLSCAIASRLPGLPCLSESLIPVTSKGQEGSKALALRGIGLSPGLP